LVSGSALLERLNSISDDLINGHALIFVKKGLPVSQNFVQGPS
jgi:hypothetical protein